MTMSVWLAEETNNLVLERSKLKNQANISYISQQIVNPAPKNMTFH